MNLAQVLSQFLNLNILILIGFLGLKVFSLILKWSNKSLSSVDELRTHYLILCLIIGISFIHPLLPGNEVFKPAAKVWSAESLKTFSKDYSMGDNGGYLSLAPIGISSSLKAENVQTTWIILASLVFLIGTIFVMKDIWLLFRIKNNSFLIRKIGKVQIFSNQNIKVPFSYWLPNQANVIIPQSLLEKHTDYKIALYHELQHHRHADTRWIYIIWGLKLICPINPFVFLWSKWISEIQEFACDETLVDQQKVESQAYARCLVEVAETAICQKFEPGCATGLTFLTESNLLKRRIEKMLSKKQNNIGRSIRISFGITLVALMTTVAFASRSLVQDRRITMAQAQVMLEKTQSDSLFPVVVNDLVLKQLNRYIGTPEGREFIKNSIQRMENYKTLVRNKISEYRLPEELIAIPIVESGYQNLTQKESEGVGAGLWQFVPNTARVFGLRVDDQVDERLNANLLTDAAMRYFAANYLRFKDWHLATMAYNVGERNLDRAIEKTGTRDAWSLIRQGYENDPDYLSRVMAAILIIRNPELYR